MPPRAPKQPRKTRKQSPFAIGLQAAMAPMFDSLAEQIDDVLQTERAHVARQLRESLADVPVAVAVTLHAEMAPLLEQFEAQLRLLFVELRAGAERERKDHIAKLAEVWFRTHPVKLTDVLNQHVEAVLAKNHGVISQAAKELGMHRRQLQRRLARKRRKKQLFRVRD
jgi:hypothetical protein